MKRSRGTWNGKHAPKPGIPSLEKPPLSAAGRPLKPGIMAGSFVDVDALNRVRDWARRKSVERLIKTIAWG